MKLKLKAITGKNKYCGPAVISALTGLTTDEAATVIRSVGNQIQVRGTYIGELLRAFKACGIGSHAVLSMPGERLGNFWKTLEPGSDEVYLVIADNHWVLLQGRKYICGQVRKPVGFSCKRVVKSAEIEAIWRLKSDKVIRPALLDEKTKQARNVASAKAKAKRLAKANGIEIDQEDGMDSIWVYGPDHVERHPDYPFEGDHVCFDWDEVLERVQDVLKFAEGISAESVA